MINIDKAQFEIIDHPTNDQLKAIKIKIELDDWISFDAENQEQVKIILKKNILHQIYGDFTCIKDVADDIRMNKNSPEELERIANAVEKYFDKLLGVFKF